MSRIPSGYCPPRPSSAPATRGPAALGLGSFRARFERSGNARYPHESLKRPDFWSFSRAGRELGELHVGYERVPEYAARIEGPEKPTRAQHRVEKMKFGKGKDKTVVHYNDFITVRDIPLEAYDYVVNGKPAIEWVMERQSVTTDKASGIVKDANAWAIETVGDARYPLSLLLRVITVSLETLRIVLALPGLDLLEDQIALDRGSADAGG